MATNLSQFIGLGGTAGTLGANAMSRALSSGLSIGQIKELAKKQGLKLGSDASTTYPSLNRALSQRSGDGIRQAITAAGPNISVSEIEKIIRRAGGDVSKALDRITKEGANLASGAANMLIKQAEKAPAGPLGMFPSVDFGTSKIGQTLQQMAGSPSTQGYVKGQVVGQPAVAPQMMIGGTVIRPGGRVAVKKQPMGAAPAVGDTTAAAPAGETAPAGDMDQASQEFDYMAMLGDLMGMTPDYGAMFGDLQTQINSMYEDLFSQFDVNDPIQLSALGQAYGGDMIRARQRPTKTRSDYLRNQLNNMAIGGQALVPMAFGGGVTI